MIYQLTWPFKEGKPRRKSWVWVIHGTVVTASPAFEWARGKGLHAVLSFCHQNGIKWAKTKHEESPQLELELCQ